MDSGAYQHGDARDGGAYQHGDVAYELPSFVAWTIIARWPLSSAPPSVPKLHVFSSFWVFQKFCKKRIIDVIVRMYVLHIHVLHMYVCLWTTGERMIAKYILTYIQTLTHL